MDWIYGVTAWVPARLCKLQIKGALDSQPQVIKFIVQLLAHGTPASSTTKTGYSCIR
jgi:hypothetical protein